MRTETEELSVSKRFKVARLIYNRHGNQSMGAVEKSTGVCKSTVQALEDDGSSRDVGYEKVAKLAAHYGVSADFLLGLSDYPYTKASEGHDFVASLPAARQTLQELQDKITAADELAKDLLHSLFREVKP